MHYRADSPVDNFRCWMNIAFMARKLLPLLLIFFWIGLSGVDILEDLDVPDQVELYNSTANPLLDHGQTARLTHNIVESAGHSKIRFTCLLEQAAGEVLTGSPSWSQKTAKLHKLHHVYLI
jgi:hypothetical protein